MAKIDPKVADHLEWIGFVRPTGLVVSAPALTRAGVILNRRDVAGQKLLEQWVESRQPPTDGSRQDREAAKEDFCSFASQVLGWGFSKKGYAGTAEAPIPEELTTQLPDSDNVFGPDYAVRADPISVQPPTAASNGDGDSQLSPWQLLVTVTDTGDSFDRAPAHGSHLSAHARMERLLRHTGAPAGLLFNGESLRLVSAPAGESSGWLDFQIVDMRQTAGRPICAAMRELLGQTRLLAAPAEKRLAALLRDSRKFQSEVSERLAEQVLHALYELLRGFQAAHDASQGELLDRQLHDDPDEVYRGLLTVVLRLVFLLYTEERDMLPQDEVFLSAYSVTGLYERLRADAATHPDTMDQRYGAYAQLLALWRMVHDGAHGPNIGLAPRHGDLFNPDRYFFLEGRQPDMAESWTHQRITPPLVSDGTVHRVLEKLIVLDAERISYRALDVEHIGSVYETMMGFHLETATGPSVAIKAAKRHGAPATINIEELLQESPGQRAKWLRDRTDRKLTPNNGKDVRAVDADGSVEAMHAALEPVIDINATPDLVPAGAMVLQPSEERRRSGSHYTPRELTEPIVRTALEPIMARLQQEADGPLRPEQILDLKVCDPAMGSGAFLVEACRQLADALIEAWHAHDTALDLPTDEDETIFARRLIAQRCLYGVDRNPKAVDLAKLSLWLTTLAKEHPLTFLDHALRHGDSLIGLSIPQLGAFHWKGDAPEFAAGFESLKGQEHLNEAAELRQLVRDADEVVGDAELRELCDAADAETAALRFLGDLAVSAFFECADDKSREARRKALAAEVFNGDAKAHRQRIHNLREADPPLAPFHWPIEFPEVFDRANPGYDAIVGNPPFGGHVSVVAANPSGYTDWLRVVHPGTKGKCDVVAHFFRRSYDLIRSEGTLGLIATNTISQGDTRASGLRYICNNGGNIYHATKRVRWPGVAAVVVSVVHIAKGSYPETKTLDGRVCDKITAFLFYEGGHDDPAVLRSNAGKSFQGSIVLGMGFTFDDTDKKGVASPVSRMRELISQDRRNEEVIFPYIGGEELNSDPSHRHHRYVINFRSFPLTREELSPTWRDASDEARDSYLKSGIVPADYLGEVASDWPDLLKIVNEKVKPERLDSSHKSKSSHGRRAAVWWQLYHQAHALHAATEGLDRVLANSSVSHWLQLAFLPADMVYSHALVVYPLNTFAAFCAMQSRLHEEWAHFFGSSMKDDLRYTPSDCFETFPFPVGWESLPSLEAAGESYYRFRADLMIDNDEGMTTTYNRLNNPDEGDSRITELRELHAEMDRAVLDAYGWGDISVECGFFLDYEIDEDTWGTRKKPYRFRWPDNVRVEVLGRLLELNAARAAVEDREGQRAGGSALASEVRRSRSTRSTQGSGTLFEGAP